MSSIHIRNISDTTLKALKARAKRHQRSLQMEIIRLLEDAASMTPHEVESGYCKKLDLHFARNVQQAATFSREETYDAER